MASSIGLTNPLRLPWTPLVKGPFIGWDAPQVMPSKMAVWTMPQLAFAAVIGFSNGAQRPKPTSTTAAGNLIILPSECDKWVVKKFLP